jgi:ATP adenylyltransferase/5',5'''-P-1,P-4-tetraphosphate phosphorylase II
MTRNATAALLVVSACVASVPMEVMCVDFEATQREAIAARENNATTSAAIEAHMISTTTVAVTFYQYGTDSQSSAPRKYIRIISMPRLLPNSRALAAGYQNMTLSQSEEPTLICAGARNAEAPGYMSPM